MIRRTLRAYRAAFAGLPRSVWLVSLVAMVNRAGTMVLPFFALYLTHERGLTLIQTGRVLSLFGIGSVLGAYLGGWLSDRVGAKPTLQISLVAGGAGFLWLSIVDGLLVISIAVLAVSVVSEAFRPAVMAECADLVPPELRPRAFALLRLAVNVGQGVGPAVGGVLALIDYRWLFVGDALTCWLAAVVLSVSIRGAGLQRPATEPAQAEPSRSPWRDGPFLLFMLQVMAVGTVFFQLFGTLPLYFKEVYGYREDAIGILLAVNPVIIVLFEMVLIYWAERRDHMLLIGAGSFLVCAGFAMMPLGSSFAFVALTILVWTLGEMLTLPLITTVVANRAGPGQRGRYAGVYTMSFGLAFVVAPVVGTWAYENLGPDRLWFGIGLMGPLLWLWVAALKRPLARRS